MNVEEITDKVRIGILCHAGFWRSTMMPAGQNMSQGSTCRTRSYIEDLIVFVQAC